MGDIPKLSTCMIVSDYDPAHYKNWTQEELAALGNCKATAEVIKRRIERNGPIIEAMYAIEHEGEKETDSESKKHHKSVDEAKKHYHIAIQFESKPHGATLRNIAKYLGVPKEVIEKPKQGCKFENMCSYLTHIKYEKKIQYRPEDVVTLAGTDYTIYFKQHEEAWLKARELVAKKGGIPLRSLYKEAERKLKNGELTYEEIAKFDKYDEVFITYRSKLKSVSAGMKEKAHLFREELEEKIRNREITSVDMITSNKHYALAYKYFKDSIDSELSQHERDRKYKK